MKEGVAIGADHAGLIPSIRAEVCRDTYDQGGALRRGHLSDEIREARSP